MNVVICLHQVQNKNSLILDAGCGTELVGKILQNKNYTNLETDFLKRC